MPQVMQNNSGEFWRTPQGRTYTGCAFPPSKDTDTLYLASYAEEQVIGSLLLHTIPEDMQGISIIKPILAILEPKHFHDYRADKSIGWNARIFTAMQAIGTGEHMDIPHILAWLQGHGLYQNGIEDYMKHCIQDYCCTALDGEHYAGVVVDFYNKRNGADTSLDNRKVLDL